MQVAGLLVLVVLIGAAALWRAPLSALVWRLLSPVLSARFGGDQSAFLQALASTTAALADRDVLYRENLDLKARLQRDGSVTRILGAVLLRPPATPYDTLVIDVGAAEGVATGDVVSAGGTAVIGIIGEVYTHAARVTLYSAPGEKYDALLRSSTLFGKGGVPLALEGQGGGSLRTQVPAGTIVAVGDGALLPGIAGGLVARVSHIERGEGESFITLYFSLPVNIFTLRFVEVWKQPTHVTE